MDKWFIIGEAIFIAFGAVAIVLFIMDMCGKL